MSRVFTETLGTLEMHAVPAHQGYKEYLGRMVSVGFQIFPFVIINVKIRINHTIKPMHCYFNDCLYEAKNNVISYLPQLRENKGKESIPFIFCAYCCS